jgi:hypothetical protein
VEVVFALPGRCWRQTVAFEAGLTAEQALQRSGLDQVYREVEAEGEPPLGVFGRKIKADHRLQAGDRLEIYRPLTADPRQRRRARVDASRRADRSGAG